jgi:hypothetical protein
VHTVDWRPVQPAVRLIQIKPVECAGPTLPTMSRNTFYLAISLVWLCVVAATFVVLLIAA